MKSAVETEADRIADVTAVIKKFVPEYKIQQKSKSWFHRFLGFIMTILGNSGYMKDFWTTLPGAYGGATTSRPTSTDTGPRIGEWVVMAHEGLHAIQGNHRSAEHTVPYLFPQVLALLGLPYLLIFGFYHGSGITIPWWPALVPLVALLPWPAPFRLKIESAAYKVSAAALYWWMRPQAPEVRASIDSFVSIMTGPSYYWMGRGSSNRIRMDFQDWYVDLDESAPATDTPYLAAIKALADRYREEDRIS